MNACESVAIWDEETPSPRPTKKRAAVAAENRASVASVGAPALALAAQVAFALTAQAAPTGPSRAAAMLRLPNGNGRLLNSTPKRDSELPISGKNDPRAIVAPN